MFMTLAERESYLARLEKPKSELEQAEYEQQMAGFDLQEARCSKRWATDWATAAARSLKQAKEGVVVTDTKLREALARKTEADRLVKKIKAETKAALKATTKKATT